jgi:ectoine hydroxylase-related dioxygenase (phytanoyl-CoA dioxygenase family)
MDDSIEPDSSIYERYTVPITRGRMVLFQSSLEHGVLDQTGGNKDRISLSFNTWFENGVGSEKGLSKL